MCGTGIVYSAKINGEPTTFGTSGLLYRSNKLMYDRLTNTVWNQFTGEPVIGPLAASGIKLKRFPVILTTWGEWLVEHPDATVLSPDTGIYPASVYEPESTPGAIYYEYFNSHDTMFPVWERSAELGTKEVVLGLAVGHEYKAYPVAALQQERVVNDVLGDVAVVLMGSSSSQAARAYERNGHSFSLAGGEPVSGALPNALVDSDGAVWSVTEEYLISDADPVLRLNRIPTHMSFWFGWFAFHPDTQIYRPDENTP